MMRQYELVERVMKYDPDADEDLLNRAYVYAMKAHGNQKRASGEAYFNHPARSGRDPDRDEARHGDDCRRAAA
jgi:(p)ppGpp synthase/HD superfamily hydrolase